MPFSPINTQGQLPDYDLKEFGNTGLLGTGCSFTPRVNIREKEGHVPGAADGAGGYGQILQTQVTRKALDIEYSAEIVPSVTGQPVGLAAAYPGQVATCAEFAADAVVHGFTRDITKLLMVKDLKRTLGNDAIPNVTVPMSYYPEIAAA